MVASLDGSTVVDARSAALSNPIDAEVLHTLRELADLLLVGAATVRVEGYGPPRKPGQRVGVVSRTGAVDLDTPLFTSGAGFLVLPHDAPPMPVDTVRGGQGEIDFAEVLGQLDADYVQAEGGATLNAALATQDVLDELDLTIAPLLVGGDGPRLVQGAAPISRTMTLAHLAEDDGYLFSRWVRER
jgi:riboflavin biosynthesis pyrimidine reductase